MGKYIFSIIAFLVIFVLGVALHEWTRRNGKP